MEFFVFFILNLQYKMFLLNPTLKSLSLSMKNFTIQNVPIKLRYICNQNINDESLQYKMFLLNNTTSLYLQNTLELYNTKCSY